MSSGEKTEQPTPKKLREARKKGQVAKSKDLSAAVVFVAGFLMTAMILPGFSGRMREFMAFCFSQSSWHGELAGVKAFEVLGKGGAMILDVTAPILGAMFALALFISYIQVGSIIAFEAMKPDLKKLNPIDNFKNKFMKASPYIEFAKNILKMAVAIALVYFLLTANFRYIVLTARQPLWESATLVGELVFKLFTQIAVFFLVVGAADFFIQKKQFMKQMKMTKEEVKQEFKQQEGDPQYKGMRKQLHQEISMHNMVEEVRNADVVVVNPKHIAVALKYDRKSMNAPQISAKGHDLWAKQIIEVAKQFGVPIMRNVPLAHSLDELEIGDEVPESLYEAVAEVLNWVYKMARK